MPPYGETDPEPSLQQDNFFKDFIFWARQRSLYPNSESDHASKALVPLQVLLHLVCSEWVTMLDYIKTRLSQLDWEIVKPEFFRMGSQGDALEKLHVWRRLVPLYREMVSETIRHISQFSSRVQAPIATMENGHIGSGMVVGDIPDKTPQVSIRGPLTKTRTDVTTSSANRSSTGNYVSDEAQLSLISYYQRDFLLIQSQLEEYQKRIDQLTSVVTAAISIEDSRRGLQNNHNIGRLTWLATLFIPLSLIAGVLSMQSNVSEISGKTFVVYFATSLPLAIVVAVAAFTLSLSRSQTKIRLRYLVNLKRMVKDFWER
jgi:Mg2+ and Co2+ transporter CorA